MAVASASAAGLAPALAGARAVPLFARRGPLQETGARRWRVRGPVPPPRKERRLPGAFFRLGPRPAHATIARMKRILIALLCGASAWAGATGTASSVRDREIATCLPGEAVTWGDGLDRPAPGHRVRLVYRHAGAPPWFDEALVLGALQRAASAWSACGIPAEAVREAAARTSGGDDPAAVTLVQWSEAATRGNFALANLGDHTLSLSAAMFRLLAERNPHHPASQTLQMAISHEMGHFFGLMAHSRRCVDAMSYYTNGRGETCSTRDGGSHRAVVEYRSELPTACDIARCRAVNGTKGR